MRRVHCLATFGLAWILLAGCSSARQTDRLRLTGDIDQARRLYQHAIALMADPQYIDKATGKVSPVNRRLGEAELDVPATQPADRSQVIEQLDKAQDLLRRGLSDCPDAGVSARSAACLLLGQVQLSRGQFHADAAEGVRTRIARLRSQAGTCLGMLTDNLQLADLAAALEKVPKDEAKRMRDRAQTDLTAAADALKTLDGKMADLEKTNEELSKESQSLLSEARELRDRGEQVSPTQGLPLLKQALELQAKANRNAGTVAENLQAVEAMQVDRLFVEERSKTLQAKVAILDARLTDMDKKVQSAADAGKQATDRAKGNWKEAEALAGEIVKQAETLAAAEKQALEAWKSAVEQFDQAEKGMLEQIQAARVAAGQPGPGQEMAAILSDDQYLATTIGLKGSACLSMADLRARQVRAAGANANLAADIIKATAKLNVDCRPLADSLAKGYLPDRAQTVNAAVQDYQAAEDALSRVLSQHLKGSPGRNTLWIYQGHLATAYLGHYRLTGAEEVLLKGSNLVGQALSGKEKSPYLASVVELDRLIQQAKGQAPAVPTTRTASN